MSTLILTCNTGEGHNSCAKAIKEVYDAHGEPCEVMDALLFVSEWFSGFAHKVHTSMYQNHPKVFKVGYGVVQKHNSPTTAKGSIPYKILETGVDRLRDYITQNNIKIIICVHPLLMMLVTALQEHYPGDYKTAYVSTDYTCCPGVKDSHPEICFIPDMSLALEFRCENIHLDQMIASGIPVRQQFYQRFDKRTAKAHFDIPEITQHLLMMCGSMGCGPMEEMLDILSKQSDAHITVVCGTNEKLCKKLSEKYEASSHIHIQGYVKNISMLMDSADIFVTKPGGLSSTEAAIKGIPMAFIDAVGGCENHNMAFFKERGCAVAGETSEETARFCMELLQDPQKRCEMETALQQLKLPNAAETIFKTMQERKL